MSVAVIVPLSMYAIMVYMGAAVAFSKYSRCKLGRDSAATRYGLDGPGIESRWERDFLHPSRPALPPPQPPIQWISGLSQG